MRSTNRLLCIRHCDTDWHEPFFVAIEEIFRCGDTFRRWAQVGGWDGRYQVFAVVEDRRLAAIAGVMDMKFVFDRAEHHGLQLGAVGTLSSYRGRGFSRQLIDWILTSHSAAGRPVILFANDTVTDFYPRFGFRPIVQRRFSLAQRLEPARHQVRRLDITKLSERTLLADCCASSAPISYRFAARDYFPAALWNLIHQPRQVFLLNDTATALVASQIDQRLIVHDVYAPSAFNLIPALASVIQAPVEEIEFCFNPEGWLPAVAVGEELLMDNLCFLSWAGNGEFEKCRFPDLAHT